jgi:hypothetical protein
MLKGDAIDLFSEVLALNENTSMDRSTWISLKNKNIKP